MKRIAALLVFLSLISAASAKPFETFDAKLKDTQGMNETGDLSKIHPLSCRPLAGAAVTVLAQTDSLSQVKIVNGQCQGLVGWVDTKNLVKASGSTD
ncbi:MAG: hypothetical protein KJ899_00895 [Gammaproteobacteria bacterium]|nr:hypothetical protein [Gammaproteobacteria bacterium]